MTSYGWTRVGTAEVIITLDDRKTVKANQVAILQSQLKEMRAEHQQAQNRLMCDVDSMADWLMGECMSQTAYDDGRSSRHYADERALFIDYSKAANMSTPELLALAMGLASNPRARIAAMDELRARYLRAQNLPGA